MKQLSWIDSMFIRTETSATPMHVNPVLIYDPSTAPGGRVTFKGILADLEARLDRVPEFRRRLVQLPFGLASPYWVDDPGFDLEFHVRHIALPKPGDWRQFCTQIARLHARPLDMSRPPWEMTVIEGLDSVEGLPPGSFAISLKVHHSAIDGAAGIQLLNVMHEPSVDAPLTPWHPERMPSTLELASRATASALTHPARAARVTASHAPRALRRLGPSVRDVMVRPMRVPRTLFNAPVSAHRVFESRFYQFEQVRQIKTRVEKATINDVALALLGGALRHYLSKHDELPGESLVAACPISIRTPAQAGSGGNMLSMMRQPLRTDLADPIERLTAITAATSADRAARTGIKAPALLEVAELMPGALLGLGVRATALLGERMPSFANVVVTNVPGSRSPLYLCGAKMVHTAGNGPLTNGIGLLHCVGSYAGEFNVCVTADRDMMPDPAAYAECIDRSFSELRALG